jgi:hypothetical protein
MRRITNGYARVPGKFTVDLIEGQHADSGATVVIETDGVTRPDPETTWRDNHVFLFQISTSLSPPTSRPLLQR